MNVQEIKQLAASNPHIEYWLPVNTGVQGVAPWYYVSSHGKIKSVEWKIIKSNGHYQMIKPRTLIEKVDKYGYLTLGYSNGLVGKENKHVFITTHRVVMLVFSLQPQPHMSVNHINHNRKDNRLCNLEWLTIADNIRHSFIDGKRKEEWERRKVETKFCRGSNHANSKMSEQTAIKILEMIRLNKYTQKQIADVFSVSIRAVKHLRLKESWNHIERPELKKKHYPYKYSVEQMKTVKQMLEMGGYSLAEISRQTSVKRQMIAWVRDHHNVWQNID